MPTLGHHMCFEDDPDRVAPVSTAESWDHRGAASTECNAAGEGKFHQVLTGRRPADGEVFPLWGGIGVLVAVVGVDHAEKGPRNQQRRKVLGRPDVVAQSWAGVKKLGRVGL